jgi:XTP/dITP diphosphohydrolase
VGGRVVLVAVTPRVPPGLLSWPAWQALRSGPVVAADPDDPQLPFLRDAGIDVEVGPVDAGVLHDRARDGETVVCLAPDAALVRAVGLRAVGGGPPVELVHGSYDPPGARLLDVVAVMDRLRSPGGCPWDADQTHASLMPYLLEEAYEAYQALEDGDLVDLREELGDVLLQVVFHARLAQEADEPWSIDDVAGDLVDKLVRRHPHVFADGDATDLETSWEALKKAEKGRTSVTDGVPLSQPALALAAKLQKRAARLGAPVPAFDGLGGELWELVRRCREAKVDPEAALRATARAYRDRLAQAEADLLAAGRDPADVRADEWAERW